MEQSREILFIIVFSEICFFYISVDLAVAKSAAPFDYGVDRAGLHNEALC